MFLPCAVSWDHHWESFQTFNESVRQTMRLQWGSPREPGNQTLLFSALFASGCQQGFIMSSGGDTEATVMPSNAHLHAHGTSLIVPKAQMYANQSDGSTNLCTAVCLSVPLIYHILNSSRPFAPNPHVRYVTRCQALFRTEKNFFFSHKLRRSSLWHNHHLRTATDGCHPTGICWSQVYLTPYRSTTSVMDHPTTGKTAENCFVSFLFCFVFGVTRP